MTRPMTERPTNWMDALYAETFISRLASIVLANKLFIRPAVSEAPQFPPKPA